MALIKITGKDAELLKQWKEESDYSGDDSAGHTWNDCSFNDDGWQSKRFGVYYDTKKDIFVVHAGISAHDLDISAISAKNVPEIKPPVKPTH
jgi:hypothetical protein